MGHFAKDFGQGIRTRRRASGFTQTQLAEAAGISEEWVRRIERGEGSPSFDTLEALAGALGTRVSTLFAACDTNGSDRLTGLTSLTAKLSDAEIDWLEKTVKQVLARP